MARDKMQQIFGLRCKTIKLYVRTDECTKTNRGNNDAVSSVASLISKRFTSGSLDSNSNQNVECVVRTMCSLFKTQHTGPVNDVTVVPDS